MASSTGSAALSFEDEFGMDQATLTFLQQVAEPRNPARAFLADLLARLTALCPGPQPQPQQRAQEARIIRFEGLTNFQRKLVHTLAHAWKLEHATEAAPVQAQPRPGAPALYQPTVSDPRTAGMNVERALLVTLTATSRPPLRLLSVLNSTLSLSSSSGSPFLSPNASPYPSPYPSPSPSPVPFSTSASTSSTFSNPNPMLPFSTSASAPLASPNLLNSSSDSSSNPLSSNGSNGASSSPAPMRLLKRPNASPTTLAKSNNAPASTVSPATSASSIPASNNSNNNNSNINNNSGNVSPSAASLAQREEAYEQAKKRIFGSSAPAAVTDESDSVLEEQVRLQKWLKSQPTRSETADIAADDEDPDFRRDPVTLGVVSGAQMQMQMPMQMSPMPMPLHPYGSYPTNPYPNPGLGPNPYAPMGPPSNWPPPSLNNAMAPTPMSANPWAMPQPPSPYADPTLQSTLNPNNNTNPNNTSPFAMLPGVHLGGGYGSGFTLQIQGSEGALTQTQRWLTARGVQVRPLGQLLLAKFASLTHAQVEVEALPGSLRGALACSPWLGPPL